MKNNVSRTKANDFLKLPIVSGFIDSAQTQQVADCDLTDAKAAKFISPQQLLTLAEG
jgi:hypothetical protein